MEGQSSITGGASDNLTTKELSAVPEMEMEILTDKVNENGNLPEGTNPSAAEAAKEASEMPLIVETTVEVCVRMVVSRKYVTNTIDPKTGRVVGSNVKTEEDPPTVVNVHTYKTSAHPPQSSSDADPARIQLSAPIVLPATPAPPVKRRPGRPRKYPVLIPSPHILSSTTIPVKRSDSVKEVTTNVSSETRAGEVEQTSADSGIDPAVGQPEDAEKAETKTRHRSTVSSGQRVLEDGSPSKQRSKKHLPAKRRVGRPSRVIKKPRKYLEDYDVEFFKSEDMQDEENSEEDEEEEEAETAAENEDKEEGWGQEEEGGKQREEKGEGGGEEEEEVAQGEEGGREAEGGGEDQRTECPRCGKNFSNSSNCQRHINKELCSRQHQCGLCNEQFSSRDLLDAHMDNQSHRDQINYRCSDCQRMYATRNGYLKHKRQGTCYKRDVFHEDGRQGEFECGQCRVRFTNDKLLDLHKEKVHENPNSEFKCPDCNRVFYSKLGFNKHVARKACTQPHECKVCGKKYSNKAKESFKSHMRYHLAETSGVQFQCEDCGRVYMTDMALKKHRLTSHSGLRPYKCGTCSKAFPMRYMVRDHERSHTGEKPFLCSLCGSSFGNRGHLYRHMRSHTLGTLHKRGRPRKYHHPHHPGLAPRTQQVVLKLSREGEEGGGVRGEDGQVFEEMVVGGRGVVEGEGGTLGVMEIKTDLPQDDGRGGVVVGGHQGGGEEEMGSTYITVHTIDSGQLGDSGATVAQSLIGDGQLQHVVMETPDGMSDNMVLQVIRNLTGATTVYQHIMEPQQTVAGAALPSSSSEAVAPVPGLAPAPQSLVPATAAVQQGSSHQLVVESGSVESVGQSVVVGGRRGIHGGGGDGQFVVGHSSQVASVTQQQNVS